jgi:predicted nucleic acid-binding protein
MQFLNTDVFIHFLTEQDTSQAKSAQAIFTAVESGNRKITTSPVVLCELITILQNHDGYNVPKKHIVSTLSRLLSLRNFTFDDKRLWFDAFTIWDEQPIGFVDAYNRTYAHHRGITFVGS